MSAFIDETMLHRDILTPPFGQDDQTLFFGDEAIAKGMFRQPSAAAAG